jgi:hypothetical protein
MEMSGQFHYPAALPPGKILKYPIDRKLGGPKTGLDTVEKRKISAVARNIASITLSSRP